MPELTEISLRNVGAEQIYDSYMGILRISPSELDGSYVDSMSMSLTNPKESNDKDREIILSDSDGTKLGTHFILKVRETDVIDFDGNNVKQKLINVVTKSERDFFVTNDFHVRSTLRLNKNNQTDKISPLQVYHESPTTVGVFDVLNYPIESPHDDSYFNSKNKLSLINYQSSVDVRTQLNNALYNKDKAWYDANIPEDARVKVGGKFIYTQNAFYEQVPIVYTQDYVLGHYTNHTARVTQEIKNKFIGTSIGPDRLDGTKGQSLFTKLSFIQIDKLVWDVVHEIAQGYIRHTEGRYTMLGIGKNETISERLFDTISPPSTTTPFLGMGVSPGIVINHAMPFHRFLFHVLRQEIRNAEDEGNDYAHLRNGIKTYVTGKKITAIGKQDPGFVNMLTKEFVLCDGKELNYDNYPSTNTSNPNMYDVDDKGIVNRGNDKKPQVSKAQPKIYEAIKNSQKDKKLVVPSLLAFEQQSPRYIRGLNWVNTRGVDTPIDITTTASYSENSYEHEIVKDKDYGKTQKNFVDAGLYRMNIDWKASEIRHKHLCFFNSRGYNREANGGNNFSMMQEIGAPNKGEEWLPETHPSKWNTTGNPIPFKEDLVKYSFTKNKTNAASAHVPNTWGNHTPVPCAGLFAWKKSKEGVVDNSATNGYVIQNSNETQISSDINTRNNQLEMINYSEGSAPIANKGGTATTWGKYNLVACHKRKKSRRTNRMRAPTQYRGGGYVLQRAIEDSETEVPRCITSLPHPNIEQEKTVHVDPLQVTMGDTVITPDTSLSFPPTVTLLPLFKI